MLPALQQMILWANLSVGVTSKEDHMKIHPRNLDVLPPADLKAGKLTREKVIEAGFTIDKHCVRW